MEDEDLKDFETRPEVIQGLYDKGFSAGSEEIVEKIAKIENKTVGEIIEKLK